MNNNDITMIGLKERGVSGALQCNPDITAVSDAELPKKGRPGKASAAGEKSRHGAPFRVPYPAARGAAAPVRMNKYLNSAVTNDRVVSRTVRCVRRQTAMTTQGTAQSRKDVKSRY